MSFDLHSHSTYSDGLLTPFQLVARAAGRGVDTLALTDHDELSGLAAARDAAQELGITLVNGVEISVSWHTLTLHIVGLQVDPGNRDLDMGLQQIRHGRLRRAEAMAKSLEQAGITGSLEGARAYAANPELVSRTHFARYLVERGHARDVAAVFKKYLTGDKPGYVPHQWASLQQAVGWIRMSGGMAVLAHPGRYKLGNAQRDVLLAEFKDLGGVGIEVVSGSHTERQFADWGRHAQRHGLLASAGSDFHGPGESYRDLGDLPALPAGCTPVWEQW
ncbi:MAG: 3',5'-nucleoside bisphosphate phosphatase [Burkholderiales bacterium]|nr:3',5'-nucleoside bisphosphate phosphatase [Burkholderiales bacterium]